MTNTLGTESANACRMPTVTVYNNNFAKRGIALAKASRLPYGGRVAFRPLSTRVSGSAYPGQGKARQGKLARLARATRRLAPLIRALRAWIRHSLPHATRAPQRYALALSSLPYGGGWAGIGGCRV